MIHRFKAEPGFAASLPSRARPETNASFLPSGDQAGSTAPETVSFVIGAGGEPSVLASQMLGVLFVFTPLLPSKAPDEANASVRAGFVEEWPPQPAARRNVVLNAKNQRR